MGIFRAKDPHKNIYTSSGGRILSREIEGTQIKYLLLIPFNADPSNKDVKVVSLDRSHLSPAFSEFEKSFLEKFNLQFPNAAKTPVGLDYVALPEWPNYNIAKTDHPSQIGQSRNIEPTFEGDPVSQKTTTMLIYMDGNNVGKFYMLRTKGSISKMEEVIDLNLSKESDFGLALWTVSASAPNVYSSLFLDIYFTAGSSKFDKILIGLPTRQASLPIGMALSSIGLK